MSEEGLCVVMTPVQLAAVLAEADVTWQEALSNRLWGGVKLVGGAVGLAGSAVLFLAPEPTLLTKVGGGALAIHGSDTAATALGQVWTGRESHTLTQRAATTAARRLGASAESADRAGVIIDLCVPVMFAGLVAAARVGAIRFGRISLLEHEATGGHTLARHVGRTEAQLRARLIAEPWIPSASTFRSLSVAETVISRAVRANAAAIKVWTAGAPLGARLRLLYEAAEVVGEGVVKGTGQLVQMSNVRLVIVKQMFSGKLYFILTAFPDL